MEEMGDTGVLLPSPAEQPARTVEILKSTLETWAGDTALRERIGAAARERAGRLFRQEQMIERTIALIDEDVSGTRNRAADETANARGAVQVG